MSHWPLVLFTYLVQMGAGLAVFGILSPAVLKDPDLLWRHLKRIFLISSALTFVGLLISLLHLGSPLKAVNALNNLAHSWLSREILVLGLFFGLLILKLFAVHRKWSASIWNRGINSLILLFAVGLVYVMSRVYMLPTIPAWNSPLTIVLFYGSAFLLGAVALLIILSTASYFRKAYTESLIFDLFTLRRRLFLFCFAGLLITSAVLIHIVTDSGSALFIFRQLFAALSLLLLIGLFYRKSPKPGSFSPLLFYAALISLIICELIGRFLFFDAGSGIAL